MTPDFPLPPEVPPVSAEELVDGVLPEDAEEPRKYPSTLGGLVYLVVLAVAAGSLLLAWLVDWRVGLSLFGASLVSAAVARVVLDDVDAGMLAVRKKWFDALLFTVMGVAIIALALTIPSR